MKGQNKFSCFLLTCIFLLLISSNGTIFASTVVSEGESVIKDDDVEAAKAVALLRAKWAAVDSIGSAKIKVDTIINNSKIIDEAIKTELTASITSYDVIEEKISGNKYIIKIKANIEDKSLGNEAEKLSKDNSLCVLVAGIMPDGSVNFNNNYTITSISMLNEYGFDVAEIDYNIINKNDFLDAVIYSNYKNILNVTNKYKCKNILLGNLSIIDKGNNTGYGTFNIHIAGGELTWKLLNSSKKVVKSGFFSGRGQGVTLNDAAINVYGNMAKTTAVKMVSQVAEEMLGSGAKSIRVVLTGSNTTLDDFNELRDNLKNIPFVLGVKELNNTSLIVNYPDKALYLGIFLEQNGSYKVVKISDNELIIRK